MLVKLMLVQEAQEVTLVKLFPSKERKRENVFKEKEGVNNFCWWCQKGGEIKESKANW